jgi:hypothetical protein
MRQVYAILAAIGLIVPYAVFGWFLATYGFDLPLIVDQLFDNHILLAFAADLTISIIVFWVYLHRESRRYQIENWWLFVVASIVIGLSFALPLFLYVREPRLDRQPRKAQRRGRGR